MDQANNEKKKHVGNIGIIGHVDHGSTTLSAATLAAISMKTENERGIIIVDASAKAEMDAEYKRCLDPVYFAEKYVVGPDGEKMVLNDLQKEFMRTYFTKGNSKAPLIAIMDGAGEKFEGMDLPVLMEGIKEKAEGRDFMLVTPMGMAQIQEATEPFRNPAFEREPIPFKNYSLDDSSMLPYAVDLEDGTFGTKKKKTRSGGNNRKMKNARKQKMVVTANDKLVFPISVTLKAGELVKYIPADSDPKQRETIWMVHKVEPMNKWGVQYVNVGVFGEKYWSQLYHIQNCRYLTPEEAATIRGHRLSNTLGITE